MDILKSKIAIASTILAFMASCTQVVPNSNQDLLSNKLLSESSFKLNDAVADGYIEEAYLLAFPDIRRDVKNGNLISGLYHYVNWGKTEGRLQFQAYIDKKALIEQAFNDGFNEDVYLMAFSDIRNAVKNGNLISGLYHYIYWGNTEGRLELQSYKDKKALVDQAYNDGYNEVAYLRAFSDIKNAVNNGNLISGLYHYIYWGKNENRLSYPNYIDIITKINNAISQGYNEDAYLMAFPDIRDSVKNGNLPSGLIHYIYWGVNENRLSLPNYLSKKNLINQGSKANISFGNNINPNAKYLELDTGSADINPNSTVTVSANAFANNGTRIQDADSSDKWLWSLSPINPFRGYIKYNGSDNTVSYQAGGEPGTVTLTAISKKTGLKKSIALNILDTPPKVESFSPADNNVSLPASSDSESNYTATNGVSTNYSVTFSDDNKNWENISNNSNIAFEKSGINGVSSGIPPAQADNYDIYVGGFSGGLNGWSTAFGWAIPADKSTLNMNLNLTAPHGSSGYVLFNARQNGSVTRRHKINIEVPAIPDYPPTVSSITPANASLSLPSSSDTVSNINVNPGSNTYSVTFNDLNADWPALSPSSIAYEHTYAGLPNHGTASSQADNYDVYVGGFLTSLSDFTTNYGGSLSGENKTITIDVGAVSGGTGYIIFNARQDGAVTRRMRFNISVN